MALSKDRKKVVESLLKEAQDLAEEDLVSVEDFNQFIKIVGDFLQKTEQRFADSLESIKNTAKEKVDAKLATVKDGKDGAPGKDGKDGAPGKDGKDGAPGKDGRDGKDSDQDEIIRVVLDNLREEIEDMREKLRSVSRDRRAPIVSIGGSTARNFVKEIDISDQFDGSTKTFNIGAFYRILTVDLSSFPHSLRKQTDYTYNANAGTITFSSEIDAATSLAEGQTGIITLVIA